MKNAAKRMLCFLLSFLLLAAFAPTAAAVSTYAPIITKQPRKLEGAWAGKEIPVKVKAKLPEGVPGELSYAWYDYDWQPDSTEPPVATGEKAGIPTESSVAIYQKRVYCVVVTNTYVDPADGETKTAQTKSRMGTAYVLAGMGDVLASLWDFKGTKDPWLSYVLFPVPLLLSVLFLFTYPLFYLELALYHLF
jgi:hypothetical protein